MNAFVRHVPAEDDFVRDLSGELIHILHVSAMAGSDTAMVMSCLSASGAGLGQVRTSRCGERMTHRLRVTHLDPSAARHLAGRLAALPGVCEARVEHLIARHGFH